MSGEIIGFHVYTKSLIFVIERCDGKKYFWPI